MNTPPYLMRERERERERKGKWNIMYESISNEKWRKVKWISSMSSGNSRARSQIFIALLLCTKLFITNNFVKGDFHISFTLRSNYYKLSMCQYGPKHGTLLVYLIDFHYFHPILQVLFIEKDNLYTIYNVTILFSSFDWMIQINFCCRFHILCCQAGKVLAWVSQQFSFGQYFLAGYCLSLQTWQRYCMNIKPNCAWI